MKKIMILIITFTFVACGPRSAEKNESKSNKNDSIQTQENKSEVKDFEKLGSNLMKNETLNGLKIGLKVSDLKNMLGEPSNKTKNELWGADGEYHQTYEYGKQGIELDMIGKKEADKTINMITIVSPCDYKTSKGISIGTNYQQVKQAYIEFYNPEFSNSESLVAGSVFGGVIFSFENSKVKTIFIGANAE